MTAITFHDARSGDTADVGFAMNADERLGQPLKHHRSKRSRRMLTGLALVGLGAATWQDPALWQKSYGVAAPYAVQALDIAKSLYGRIELAPGDARTTPTAVADATQKAAPLPPIAPAQDVTEPPRASPEKTAAPEPASATPQGKTYEAPKAPPGEAAQDVYTEASPRPTDPLKKRAAAAGLHPGLPRAVLEKLTDTDLKSASVAIRKALSSSDDGTVVIWPAKVREAAAQFRVSFVEGAGPDCRRYVVAIARDGWRTTALPVEKCAAQSSALSKS